ncbi:hypothetical protein PV328_004582, partial [Microctonus aethiopoides]
MLSKETGGNSPPTLRSHSFEITLLPPPPPQSASFSPPRAAQNFPFSRPLEYTKAR